MNKRILFTGAVVVMSLSMAVSAQTTPWSNPSGSNARFGWSGGANNTNPLVHFGSPDVTEAGFFYNGITDFQAEMDSGIYPTSATDVTRAQINVMGATPPALPIDTIIVREWGEWYNSGESGVDYSIFNVQADFRIIRMIPPGPTTTHTLAPVSFDVDEGTWSVEIEIDTGGLQMFQFQLENIVSVSNGDAGSYISKLGTEIIVPEPASALLFGGACIFLLQRPRRSR